MIAILRNNKQHTAKLWPKYYQSEIHEKRYKNINIKWGYMCKFFKQHKNEVIFKSRFSSISLVEPSSSSVQQQK